MQALMKKTDYKKGYYDVYASLSLHCFVCYLCVCVFLSASDFHFYAFCRCKDTFLFVITAFLPTSFRV